MPKRRPPSKTRKQIAERVEEVLDMPSVASIQSTIPKIKFVRRSGKFYVFKVSIYTRRTRKSFSVRVR